MNFVSIRERDYWAAQAKADAEGRSAAEAANGLLTESQNTFLTNLLEQKPFDDDTTAQIICDVFETIGWPDQDLESCWLDASGQIAWAARQFHDAVCARPRS